MRRCSSKTRWLASAAALLLTSLQAFSAQANPLPIGELAQSDKPSCGSSGAAAVGMALSWLLEDQSAEAIEAWLLEKGELGCSPTDLALAKATDEYCKAKKVNAPWCAVATDWAPLTAFEDGLAQIKAGRGFVAHTDLQGGNHFVVVVGLTEEQGSRYVYYNDPSDGARVKKPFDDFVQHWNAAGYRGLRFPIDKPVVADAELDEVIHLSGVLHPGSTSDVDGDGRADLCARGPAGVQCFLSVREAFDTVLTGPELSDELGWEAPAYYSTIRLGDLNADGRADLCARGKDGIQCWLATSAGFGPAIQGPELSDSAGWNQPEYYSTLQLADVNGDRRDDLCGRSAAGFQCWLSTGVGFHDTVSLPDLSDAEGWNEPRYFGTLRMGDLNNDGLQDVCGRSAKGVFCWLSEGKSFSRKLQGPGWSDAAGWGKDYSTWSTIRLADINGDGKDDLCGRSSQGIHCHLSRGTSFGPEILGPALSDTQGWSKPELFSTIRLADVNGDGSADLCARDQQGIICYASTGSGFGGPMAGPSLSDASGSAFAQFFRTILLADVDADGKADTCAREHFSFRCWPSTGGAAALFSLPAVSDAAGWGAKKYYSTLRMYGLRPKRAISVRPSVELRSSPTEQDPSLTAEDSTGMSCSMGTSSPSSTWLVVIGLALALGRRSRSSKRS